MAKNDLPNILKPRRLRGENRWQRFWRRRRMNSVRNSSDHAAVMAVGILVALILLAGALVFVARNARLPAGPGKPGLTLPPPSR